MKLTITVSAGTVTDAQIRALRTRLGAETYAGSSNDAADCDVALAAPIGSLRRVQARARCAEIFNTRGGALALHEGGMKCLRCGGSGAMPTGQIHQETATCLECKGAGHLSAVVSDSGMTLDEAHDALVRFSLQSDSQAALGACRVLDEVTRLRQLLRDLVDFDMGVPPECDALCAIEGPRKLARMANAWKAALAEVGPRNELRYEGDEP